MKRGLKILAVFLLAIYLVSLASNIQVQAPTPNTGSTQNTNTAEKLKQASGVLSTLFSIFGVPVESREDWQNEYEAAIEIKINNLGDDKIYQEEQKTKFSNDYDDNAPAGPLKAGLKNYDAKIASIGQEIKRWERAQLIFNTFSDFWFWIRFLIIPIVLTYIFRNFLLGVITGWIDTLTKTKVAGEIGKILMLGSGLAGFVIWFVVVEIFYFTSLRGSFIEKWIGMAILWITMVIMDIFGMNPLKSTQVKIAILIAMAIIVALFAIAYILLSKVTNKFIAERRALTAKKLGRNIKALKETANAAAEGLDD